MTNPIGEVWLQRARPADATDAIYDVYGPDAAWKQAVHVACRA